MNLWRRDQSDQSRTVIPVTPKQVYNESWKGAFGEFGSGGGLHAMYLVTSISPRELDKVFLLEDIPGSERWRVRDLFQREVDKDRVTHGLLPYLEAKDRVRFFNPLTLTVLPVDESGKVIQQMPRTKERLLLKNSYKWRVLERPNYYRMRHILDQPEYGEIDWNERSSRIVAIDGQHRLSALKRLDSHRNKDPAFNQWRIPVVIVSFRAAEGREEPPGVLEVVRGIFVDINTEAREVNEARQILLNDRSVNCLATQELLEAAHENDLKPLEERRRESVPLVFFDWQGRESDGKPVRSPAAVLPITEVRSWFEHYVLGEDFSERQRRSLPVESGEPLNRAFDEKKLSFGHSKEIRARVRGQVLEALSLLLEEFEPYRAYIAALRSLEEQYYTGNDVQCHAFDQLRFGTSRVSDSMQLQVQQVAGHVGRAIVDLRRELFAPPLDNDVAMRGVLQAFGALAEEFGYPDWADYATWFTAALNDVYLRDWLSLTPGSKGAEYLQHIIVDHNDNVVNYRLEHAQKALGPWLSLLLVHHEPPPHDWMEQWPSVRVYLLDKVQKTLAGGFRKELRPQLKETYPEGGRPLTVALQDAATLQANRQLRRFERELGATAGVENRGGGGKR